jgi:hypothetical protein
MDKHDAHGFFRERAALQSRRIGSIVDPPAEQSDDLTQRVAAWVTGLVAVFTPVFANAVIFGWINLKSSMEILVGAISCILVVAGALGACRA